MLELFRQRTRSHVLVDIHLHGLTLGLRWIDVAQDHDRRSGQS
jgi:hypothetical protein